MPVTTRSRNTTKIPKPTKVTPGSKKNTVKEPNSAEIVSSLKEASNQCSTSTEDEIPLVSKKEKPNKKASKKEVVDREVTPGSKKNTVKEPNSAEIVSSLKEASNQCSTSTEDEIPLVSKKEKPNKKASKKEVVDTEVTPGSKKNTVKELNSAEIVSSPKKTSSQCSESSEDEIPLVSMKEKPNKTASKKEVVDVDVHLPELMKENDIDEDDVPKKGKTKKVGTAKSKRGAQKKKKVEEADSPPESILKRFASTESLKNITFRSGIADMTFSVNNVVENLPALMNQLEIDEDDVPKKGKKKKVGAAKSKRGVQEKKKKEETDSEPESNLKRCASTDNLKNTAIRPGLSGRSFSANNLHSLTAQALDRPKRAAAIQNGPAHYSDFVDELAVKSTRTKKTIKKKAAK